MLNLTKTLMGAALFASVSMAASGCSVRSQSSRHFTSR